MIVVSIFSKHEDFIELQYNSMVKHLKGNYEYVILNNASDANQSKLNRNKCDELGIRCIDIASGSGDPSDIAGVALNNMFHLFKGETILKIDSDMFFMSDVDLDNIFNRHDSVYIPIFSANTERMWSGVFGLKSNMTSSPINCLPRPGLDPFGESNILVETTNRASKMKLFGLFTVDGNKISGCINNDCVIQFDGNGELISVEREDYVSKYDLLDCDLYEKFASIVSMVKKYDFPIPYMLDIIELDGVNSIFHFKSASWEYTNAFEYVNNKKQSMKKLLQNTKGKHND